MEELIKAYVEARKRNGMSKCKAIRHVTQQFIYVPRGKLVKVLIEGCKLNLRPSERNITSLTENGPSTSRQLGPKSVGRQGQSNPKSKMPITPIRANATKSPAKTQQTLHGNRTGRFRFDGFSQDCSRTFSTSGNVTFF